MGDLEWWQFLGGILVVLFGAAWLLRSLVVRDGTVSHAW